MRSDLMEKTSVKSLLAPWLARHSAWEFDEICLMGKQLSNVNVAKTMLVKRRALAKPSVTESHFETKPKWNQRWERVLGKDGLV